MTTYHAFKTSRMVLLVTAATVLAALAAPAQIVSVNIFQNAGADIQQIDSDETFGIAAYGSVAGNWQNLNAASNNLTSSLGLATTVDFTLTQPNGQATFNAAYADTPLHAGLDDYTTTVNPVSITLGGLNATFSSGYFAIVFVGGFNTCSNASISDGTTTFFYQTLKAPAAPVTFVQSTQTTDLGLGNNPVAQYAVFGSVSSPLTGDSVTFTLDTLYGGGAALGGVQIVAVPEPSSGLIIMMALGLVAWAGRGRRNPGAAHAEAPLRQLYP